MEVVNATSFRYAHVAGRLNYPGHTLTLIVKGTFDLNHGGTATPSEEQLYPTGDEFYPDDDEMAGSCRYEYDFAFLKPRTDLLCAGHCNSPGGKPVPASRVTFRAGSHSRMLYVYGNRKWKGPPGMRIISDPEPFTSMELRYENSYGGPVYEKNPVGKGHRKEKNEAGANEWLLPNIEDPEHLIDSPNSSPEPAGYGPLGRMWKQRFSKMGTYTGDWKTKRWPWFPLDFDWSHFNAAPPGMQVDGYLRGDEPLFFENMHSEHARYESRLPGTRVRCFLNTLPDANTNETKFSEVTMKLDTLWADTDAEKLVLVWRGSAEVQSEEYEEVQHVFIMSEPVDQEPASLEQCYKLFLATQAAEEEEFAVEPEKPEEAEIPEEPVTAVPKVAVPGIAAAEAAVPGIAAAEVTELEKEKPEEELLTEEAPKTDPATIKAQAKALLAQSGFDMEKLPLDTRNRIDQEMDKVISLMSETDTSKVLEQQKAELESRLTDTFSKLGIDTENLPPVSEKARQEQMRMLKELGLEDTDAMFQNPDMAKIMNYMMALYPKLGYNPENLTPLIEIAKKQQQSINRQMSGSMETTDIETKQSSEEDRNRNDEQ